MPRTCFVIMPFSKTNSCEEIEWTDIFQNLIKPSVENAGLDYICRRSVATRGNIVGGIIQDLNDSHVVIADLTDRNANVFYELGVRHTLKDRSILIAQNEGDIPFDLLAYARHVYNWRTSDGRTAFAEKIRALLTEIDNKPDRPDNPVSDFLGKEKKLVEQPLTEIAPSEILAAQPLIGSAADGINVLALVRSLEASGKPQNAKVIYRLTKNELVPQVKKVIAEMNGWPIKETIPNAEIVATVSRYIECLQANLINLETFGLASVSENWEPGLETTLKMCGDLITLSDQRASGRSIRLAQDAPSFVAFKIMVLCGAKCLEEDNFKLLKMILKTPIEVEESSGRFTYRPLLERRDLVYPEAFLGNASYPMFYLDKLWGTDSQIPKYFGTEENYQLALAKFFILFMLLVKPDPMGSMLYPGYRLLNGSRRAMSALTNRMFCDRTYLDSIASIIDQTGLQFQDSWEQKTKLINEIGGTWEYRFDNVAFPGKFGESN